MADTAQQIAGTPFSHLSLKGLLGIPAVRQVSLLVGVAIAVAAGVWVVLWSQDPSFAQLYSDVDAADAAEITEALRSAGIEYKVDTDLGVVMVPQARLQDARLELASQGLPAGGAGGMAMLQEQSGFGVSQFMESARYQAALEAELGRTIAHLGAVRDARVHLAMPKQSSFIRDRNEVSASVLLELYRGADLEPGQASAIVHLVASSIPNLSASNVTLIDQRGRLLSSPGDQAVDAQVGTRLKYVRELEDTYKRRIEDLLTPLVGPGRVRAQVAANIDFTVTEETRESFDPAQTVVRSEQISEQRRQGAGAAAEGVPGALSNQPPEAGSAPAADASPETAATEPVNTSRSSTRNFEVDRTISRVQPQPGRIERLSVAVLVDESTDDGEEAALTDADIDRFTALAKEAVGFDEKRGDTVVVMTAAFRPVPDGPPAEAPSLLDNPVVRDVAKLVLGAVVVLALGFGLVRPMFKGLLASHEAGAQAAAGAFLPGAGGARLSGGQYVPPPPFEDKVTAARNITGHDPARVAQVVRKWLTANE